VTVTGTVRKQFFIFRLKAIHFYFFLQSGLQHTIVRPMTFYSLPFTPERTQATEARLEAIYEAARYGLKGDSLAMAAGLTPRQYRVLADADPLVEMAEIKGRADGEYTAAKTMYDAARDGDSKAALEILKHQHGWVAKQQIDVNIDQQISITGALEKAQQRVIEGTYLEIPQIEDNTPNAAADLQRIGRDGIDVAAMVAGNQG
jgi:ribosomal protein S11